MHNQTKCVDNTIINITVLSLTLQATILSLYFDKHPINYVYKLREYILPGRDLIDQCIIDAAGKQWHIHLYDCIKLKAFQHK